ncbi:MAG: transporter substrate-binding domain-containing protein [Desulfovibrionaceae bacterium]|nr:transporter substrate-binding domain-containing protein [Desulfovibrionaceae bacterium]
MKTYAKRIIALLLLLGVAAYFWAGCSEKPGKLPGDTKTNMRDIASFRDIPGITDEEIAAIENLISKRDSFSFGSLGTTETFRQPDGTYTGFTVMFRELLSGLFGIPFVLREYTDWTVLKDDIDSLETDFSSEFTPTPERKQAYLMTLPVAERSLGVFTCAACEGAPIVTSEDGLNGWTIGFFAGTITAQSIRDAYPEIRFKTVNLHSTAEVVEQLQAGAIDAFIVDYPFALSFEKYDSIQAREMFPLIYTPVSLTTRNPEYAPLISAVNKYILSGGIDRLHELYIQGNIEYTKYALHASLTDEEKAYIANLSAAGAKVPVVLEADNYPVCFYNAQEKAFQGIVPDFLAEISLISGIEFEVVNDENTPWNEMLDMLSSGRAALISQLLYTEERAENFLFSYLPYTTSHYALLSRSDYPYLKMYQVERLTVGVGEDSAYAAIFKKYFPNHGNVKYYPSQDEVLDALERGEVDLVMASEHVLLTLLNYREKTGFKVNIRFNSPLEESYLGYNKNEKMLRSIFYKTRQHLNIERIEGDWIKKTFDYEKKYVHQRSTAVIIAAIVLLLLFVLLAILFIKNNNKNKEIQRVNRRVRIMLDKTPLVCTLWDRNFKIYDCNKKAVRLFKLKDKQEYIDRFHELSPERQPDGRLSAEAMDRNLRKAYEEGRYAFEWLHQALDGTLIPMEVTLVRVYGARDYILTGYARDLRAHRKMMEEIKKRDVLLHAVNHVAAVLLQSEPDQFTNDLYRSLGMLASVVDVDRVRIWRNHTDNDGFRYTPLYEWPEGSELQRDGKYTVHMPHGEIIPGWESSGILSKGGSINSLVRDLSPAEQARLSPQGIVSVLVVPVLLQDYFWGFVGFYDSHNERRFSENEEAILRSGSLLIANALLRNEMMLSISTSAAQIEAVITHYPGIIYCVDKDESIVLFNGTYLKQFDFTAERIVGKKLGESKSDLLHSDIIANTRKTFIEGPQDWVSEHVDRIFHIRTAPIYADNGTVLYVVGSIDDITDMVTLQNELKEALLDAYEASNAKSDFLAQMSHEIRTPMNAIIGMTELALRSANWEIARDYIMETKLAGANLLSLINDILDLSKIESGKLTILPVNYLFSSLINDVISIIKMRLIESHVRFVVNIDSDIPNALIGDELRIRQLLINLLSNAVKYTEQGFVSLLICGEHKDEHTVELTIEVKDSGIGIKQEHIGELFGAFIKFDEEKNRNIEGTGLGLAITHSIVTAMGGSITVASEYGKGSTFTVTLPQKIHTADKMASVENPGEKAVFIFERREIYANSIMFALNSLGVKYTLATNEHELEEKLAGKNYAFIFVSDVLFGKHKDLVKSHSANSRLVLLTEFGEATSNKDLPALSMPVYALPIANIMNGLSESFAYNTSKESVARFTAPDAKILIVDDINTNLRVAAGLLQPYHMQVDLCKSGMEAIEALKSKHHDVVFMDHRMPEMDGVETTRRIRAMSNEDPYYDNVPIIALTANATSGMREIFLENGFTDYLSKPIDTIALNALLERWIPKEKQQQSSSVTGSYPAVDTREIQIEISGINVKKGLSLTGGAYERYLDTLATFREDGLEKIEKIKKSLADGDLPLYTTYVHALKSAAANIGAEELSKAAYALETAGRDGNTGYIEAHNNGFLESLQTILSNIHSAIAAKNEKEAGEKGRLDRELFNAELENLKTALESMDAEAMDNTFDSLKAMPLSEDMAAAVRNISYAVMMAEYDKAVALMESLLRQSG